MSRREELAEDALQAHDIAGHFVIVKAEGFPQRVAADALLYACLARYGIDDLVCPLPGNGLMLFGSVVNLSALKGKSVPASIPAVRPVDLPARRRIDQDPRFLAGLFRLDLPHTRARAGHEHETV